MSGTVTGDYTIDSDVVGPIVWVNEDDIEFVNESNIEVLVA